MKWKVLTTDTISLFFVLLWIYAAASKLVDYEKFQIQLSKSPMLTQFSAVTAWFVPLIEIIISILLFTAKFRLIGLYASFCLMTVFTAYIYAITNYSEVIPCSCGGILEDMNWQQHFLFNSILVPTAAFGILIYSSREPINQPSSLSAQKILFE